MPSRAAAAAAAQAAAQASPRSQMDLVGLWRCNRESDITGDPACKTLYQWSFSMAQCKLPG